VQLTAVRLLRAFVELDGRMVEAFLAADGLAQIVPILSAAVAAGANTTATSSSTSLSTAKRRQQLVLQYELLAVLDSLSLVHRRVLVQAAIVPIIVGVLRQHLPQQQQQQDKQPVGSSSEIAGAAATLAAAGQVSGPSTGIRSPGKLSGRPTSAGAAGVIAAAAAAPPAGPSAAAAAAGASSRVVAAGSSSRQRSKSLTRSSSRAPGAAAGVSACGMPDAELLLRCKVIACQLITVLVSHHMSQTIGVAETAAQELTILEFLRICAHAWGQDFLHSYSLAGALLRCMHAPHQHSDHHTSIQDAHTLCYAVLCRLSTMTSSGSCSTQML
jgi:hypothetical protein